MSDDGARRVSPDLRARVLIYFVSGWSPSDALIHLYCQGVRMTRADYLSVIRAYCTSAGNSKGKVMTGLSPRIIAPWLIIIAACALAVWIWLEMICERDRPWRFGDRPRRPASPESQVAGLIVFLTIILAAKDLGGWE